MSFEIKSILKEVNCAEHTYRAGDATDQASTADSVMVHFTPWRRHGRIVFHCCGCSKSSITPFLVYKSIYVYVSVV